jgi:hypothetical protein
MAIAFDATTGGHGETSSNTITFSHTVGSGDNRCLIVRVGITNREYAPVSGVTYNGTSMTLVTSVVGWVSTAKAYVFVLKNPDSGAHNVVITLSASGYSSFTTYCASSYTGVDQTNPIDSYVSIGQTSGSNSSISQSITPNLANSLLIDYYHICNNGPDTINAAFANSQTGEMSEVGAPSGIRYTGIGGRLTTTTVSSHTMGITFNSSQSTAIIVALAEVQISGPTNLKSYNTNLKANIKSINTNLIANVKSLDTIV